MPFEKFRSWEDIDGSSVSDKEIEETFQIMMSKARIFDSHYQNQYDSHRNLQNDKRRHGHLTLVRTLIYSAACVALMLVTSLAVKYVMDKRPVALSYTQAATANGEIREVILPDQTKVVLNAGSVLIYPETFGSERSVYLSGEAIFDVTSSKEHPFIVKTSDVSVKVHGTKFNVRSYSDDSSISATLCRGAISAFPNGHEEKAVAIRPNQNYTFDKSTKHYYTTDVNALESTSWESGDICFESESIHEIIKTIERRYDVNVYLSTGKYDSAVITAKFINGESLNQLMSVLSQILPGMKYSIQGSSVYLK